MDRSIYTVLSSLFEHRPRELALSRAEIRQRLIELCGVEIHVRDIQSLIAKLQDDGYRIISEARGYWTLGDSASAEEMEAARHALNARRAHGEAEIEDARRIGHWIEEIAKRQKRAESRRLRSTNQVGLFTY